jgi:predicted Holliday junction resolvase-like endonuclease
MWQDDGMGMLLIFVAFVIVLVLVAGAKAQARRAACSAQQAALEAESARRALADLMEEEQLRRDEEREEREQLALEAACDHNWEHFGDWRQCNKCGASQNMAE